MKKVWSAFWHVLEVILNSICNLAEAGEMYSASIRDDAEIDRTKAQAKLAKAKAKLDQAEA